MPDIISLMKTAAIIAEYNPFHQGHAWQIGQIRKTLGDDCAVIAAMSGSFVQRGEPAIFDKWTRARSALACGADLILELPFAYAAASAERFAAGGVQLLQATGLDCQLVFGSEAGDLPVLQKLADIFTCETDEYKVLLHHHLDQGLSFPAARQRAVADLTGQPDLADQLSGSNNILAIEYLKAIKALPQCRLVPMTLPRQGQSYRDSGLSDAAGFASASAIRRTIAGKVGQSASQIPDIAGLIRDLDGQLPLPSLALVLEKIQAGLGPLFLEQFALPILGLLRSRPVSQLEQVPGMGEGLARRLVAAAARPGIPAPDADAATRTSGGGQMATLLHDCATRRFPQTRIQRVMIAMLAGVTADDLLLFDEAGGPQYLRVLGFNRKGQYLLKIMRQKAEKPILMKGSDLLEQRGAALVRMAELDYLATDLWMLAAARHGPLDGALGTCGRDFDTPVLMG
jgi:predicted nucleotidyltransferase